MLICIMTRGIAKGRQSSLLLKVDYKPPLYIILYTIRFPLSPTGPNAPHNFVITFYALWTTTFEVRLNGNLTQTDTFNGTGLTNKVINLPNDLRPPVLYNLAFNYTDFCAETRSTALVRVDEEISGLTIRVSIS